MCRVFPVLIKEMPYINTGFVVALLLLQFGMLVSVIEHDSVGQRVTYKCHGPTKKRKNTGVRMGYSLCQLQCCTIPGSSLNFSCQLET